jgi:pimeloyl-ACP methyl ester carboxylesterase
MTHKKLPYEQTFFMARSVYGLLAGVLLSLCASLTHGESKLPLEISEVGSMHVGGRYVDVTGKPTKEVVFSPGSAPAVIDPNGKYLVEQMYVQYFIPKNTQHTLPILLWHGGGLTGVTYETTPDGRDGWMNFFIHKGWKTYVSDAVERGRSGWASPDIWSGEPQFLTIDNPWQRFRMGKGLWSEDPSLRQQFEGGQFPPEGYLNFMKQIVPRWTTTDAATIKAYTELVERVCPCVVLVHSQGGQFGQRVAQARPDLVKGLVLVEPAGFGDPERASAMKGMPILTVYGDNIKTDSRWPKIRQTQLDLNAKYSAAGADVRVIDLPDIGIKGNSHMMMMDRNNLQIAQLIEDWLREKGLAK